MYASLVSCYISLHVHVQYQMGCVNNYTLCNRIKIEPHTGALLSKPCI